MSALRRFLVLSLVVALSGGCTLVRLVDESDARASASPGPSAGASPGLLPSRAPGPTPSAAPPAPTSAPTPRPTPTPAPTLGPATQVGVQLLRAGGRAPADAPARDVARLVRGSTDFALDLLARVIRTSDGPNVVIGPSSITAAFALLHAGARGDTAREMERVLGLDLPMDRLNAAYNALEQAIASRQGPKVTVSVANQLFGQAGYPFERSYLQVASRQFGAPLASVEFRRNPTRVTRIINDWIADRTNDRITDILPPGQLNEATRLVLVNATYLKAEWASTFEKAFTTPREFTRPDGSTVTVPMMFKEMARVPAAFADGYVAVELPYVGGKLAMLLVMPDRPTAFLRALDADGLAAIVASLQTSFEVQGVPFSYVELWMPRFSTRTRVALRPVLTRMGMRSVWLPGAADLTGIVDPAMTGEAPLNASSATHEAWVKVTEKGTEAAAVTIIDVGTGGGGPEVPPPQIVLDRTFLWFIRDRQTGAILFAGQVTDPSDTAR